VRYQIPNSRHTSSDRCQMRTPTWTQPTLAKGTNRIPPLCRNTVAEIPTLQIRTSQMAQAAPSSTWYTHLYQPLKAKRTQHKNPFTRHYNLPNLLPKFLVRFIGFLYSCFLSPPSLWAPQMLRRRVGLDTVPRRADPCWAGDRVTAVHTASLVRMVFPPTTGRLSGEGVCYATTYSFTARSAASPESHDILRRLLLEHASLAF
jgi:hypothetical protein